MPIGPSRACTSGLPGLGSPRGLPDIATAPHGDLRRRDFHPLVMQLASLRSLPRVPAVRVPLLRRYYGVLRRPAADPAALRYSFAWPYLPVRLCSLPRTRRRPGAWSFGSGSPTPETTKRQRRDLSGSWGILLCICRVLRPRQDRHVRTYDGVGAAPVLATTKAPANLPSFEAQSHGLCTRCLRFALGIAPPGRKTRFPLLSALRDGIGYPQDSNERFPRCSLHLFLLSQACLTQCQRSGRHRPVNTLIPPIFNNAWCGSIALAPASRADH